MRTAPCCCCGRRALAALKLPAAWPGVASDCRLWPRAGALARCRFCGHVQKTIGRAWLADIAKIYGSYGIYHLSGGAEQLIFKEQNVLAKSARMLSCLNAFQPLPRRGRLLDVGCGNGSLLRSFHALRPKWRLEGTEQSRRFEAAIRKIPGVTNFYASSLKDLNEKYDLITLLNVFEHLPDPLAALRILRPLLAKSGKILIQVPNLLENPFDLMVVDHRSHFTPATLARVTRSADFQCLALKTNWVAKEISLLLAPSGIDHGKTTAKYAIAVCATGDAAHPAAWLKACAAEAADLAKKHGPKNFGIFGTAIAGTWLGGMLGRSFSFFVDEDPHKSGKRHLGRPIYAPAHVPEGANVFLAFPEPMAVKVAARLKERYPRLKVCVKRTAKRRTGLQCQKR